MKLNILELDRGGALIPSSGGCRELPEGGNNCGQLARHGKRPDKAEGTVCKAAGGGTGEHQEWMPHSHSSPSVSKAKSYKPHKL